MGLCVTCWSTAGHTQVMSDDGKEGEIEVDLFLHLIDWTMRAKRRPEKERVSHNRHSYIWDLMSVAEDMSLCVCFM